MYYVSSSLVLFTSIPSCVYISYWYVFCVCTFRIRVLNKSVININYQSAILISVVIPISPATLYLVTMIKKNIYNSTTGEGNFYSVIYHFTRLQSSFNQSAKIFCTRPLTPSDIISLYYTMFNHPKGIHQQWKLFNIEVCVETLFSFSKHTPLTERCFLHWQICIKTHHLPCCHSSKTQFSGALNCWNFPRLFRNT